MVVARLLSSSVCGSRNICWTYEYYVYPDFSHGTLHVRQSSDLGSGSSWPGVPVGTGWVEASH